MTTPEIGNLSESLNLKALLDYRLAVGKCTQDIVKDLKAEDLLNKPDPEHLNLLVSNNTVREDAQWLLAYWGGHPKYNLLLMPATRHGFVHLNEVRRMFPKLRRLAT